MHYSENYSIFFSQNRIPSEPSSPMLRLLAQTFERMISQKKRNRGIKRRRLLQNVTPLLTSSETHSSWSKQTNKRKKNKDCRKTRKCSEITAPYQCYIKSLVPYRFKLRLKTEKCNEPSRNAVQNQCLSDYGGLSIVTVNVFQNVIMIIKFGCRALTRAYAKIFNLVTSYVMKKRLLQNKWFLAFVIILWQNKKHGEYLKMIWLF